MESHDIQIRVRYCETDAMGFLHHANYFNYFEMGRTELLRAHGGNYRKLEESGFFFVVAKVQCSYRSPARYDDLLTLRTRLSRRTAYKLEHSYELLRDTQLVAEAQTTLACLDRDGQIQPISAALPEA